MTYKPANRTKILGDIQKALSDTADEAARANITAMQLSRYPWPRQTVRKSGEVAGLVRDIVDLAGLVGSQRLEQVRQGVFALTWGGSEAPYAAAVFYGATTRNGTHLPARKWIYEAIRGGSNAPKEWRNDAAVLNISDYFAARYRQYAAS